MNLEEAKSLATQVGSLLGLVELHKMLEALPQAEEMVLQAGSEVREAERLLDQRQSYLEADAIDAVQKEKLSSEELKLKRQKWLLDMLKNDPEAKVYSAQLVVARTKELESKKRVASMSRRWGYWVEYTRSRRALLELFASTHEEATPITVKPS